MASLCPFNHFYTPVMRNWQDQTLNISLHLLFSITFAVKEFSKERTVMTLYFQAIHCTSQ